MRLAIQEGGSPNPELNSKLAGLIDEALRKNMPGNTINTIIKKLKDNPVQLKKQFYELKLMNKVFLNVEFYVENQQILKNNINTAVRKEKRSALSVNNAMFNHYGLIQASIPKGEFKSLEEFEEKVTEDAIECNAIDVEEVDFPTRTAVITCEPDHIHRVKTSLIKLGYDIDLYEEDVFVPHNPVTLNDEEKAIYDSLIKRLSIIEGFEKVYDNVERSE